MQPPRPIVSDDRAAVAAILGAALPDDPGWRFAFPVGRDRPDRIAALITTSLRHRYEPTGRSWLVEDDAGRVVGAALWEPARTGGVAALRAVPGLALAIGTRLPAALRSLRAMTRHHPPRPARGARSRARLARSRRRPTAVGPGAGRRRSQRHPCWLESTNPHNHAFYRRLGFAAGRGRPELRRLVRALRATPRRRERWAILWRGPEWVARSTIAAGS